MAPDVVPVVVIVTDDDKFRESITTLIESRSIGVICFHRLVDYLPARHAFNSLCLIVDLNLQDHASRMSLAEQLHRVGAGIPLVLVS